MNEDAHLEMAYEDANGSGIPDDEFWDDEPNPYNGTYSEE